MKARLWFRFHQFVDRHAAKIAVVLVVAGTSAGLAGVRWEAGQRADKDQATLAAIDAAANDRRVQICDWARRSQRADRLLIATVLETPSTGIPLLDVPSYQSLPPAVQEYVREIATAGDPPPEGASLAERLATYRDENLGPDDLPTYCVAEP